jgi:hypothetical protein
MSANTLDNLKIEARERKLERKAKVVARSE